MTSLNDGGPYQAVMVAKCFGELSRKFQRLPTEEQTEERRSMIQRFSDVQEQASLMTSLYGDELGKGAQRAMTNEQKVKYLGLKAKPELSMDRVTNMLTAQARLREQNGLQPIVILPRPLEASDKEKVVIERY
jgi:hypothetical protein